jgi:simple sugar transport system ATP-binding protein/ribose transport system ATP-binding protein
VTPVVEVRGVGKRFGRVQALYALDLAVRPGEVHGLVGENGAGKSTLGKMIAGVIRPDGGELLVDGAPVAYRSPHDALQDGLTLIAQEIALVPRRTVIENVFLGLESSVGGFVRRRELERRYAELATSAGFTIDAGTLVGELRFADQQKVEILRALARGTRLIVMDEPTAGLTKDEADRLMVTIRALRERGTAVVYVSHFLEEVLLIADTVTVLKDGRLVRTGPSTAETPQTLIAGMTGRKDAFASVDARPVVSDAQTVLRVTGLSRRGAFQDVSFDVGAGEVLGIAGLVGSGRTEVVRAIFGAERPDGGTIELDAREVRITSPRVAVRNGIALLPESRKDEGLVMRRSIAENVTLPHLGDVSRWGFVDRRQEQRLVAGLMTDLDVRADSQKAPVGTLSGGNQQKVLFAKWLLSPPRLLLVDEPTRGVDIAAKHAIYELLRRLSEQGVAIVMVSSDIEEILAMAHRAVVMRAGRVMAEIRGEDLTEENVMNAALGGPRMFGRVIAGGN